MCITLLIRVLNWCQHLYHVHLFFSLLVVVLIFHLNLTIIVGCLLGIFQDSIRAVKAFDGDADGGPPPVYNWTPGPYSDFGVVSEGGRQQFLLGCRIEGKSLLINCASLEDSPLLDGTEDDQDIGDSDTVIADNMIKESAAHLGWLTTEIHALKSIKLSVSNGKLAIAMEHQEMTSRPVANLVLNKGLLKVTDDEKLSSFFTLNDLKIIVPKLKELLTSDQKEHVDASLSSLREILRTFSSIIKTQGGTLKEHFVQVRKVCTQLASSGGAGATNARELSRELFQVVQ